MKPRYIFTVSILYKHDKREEYESTDFPHIGDQWITLYNYSKRLMIPTDGISEISYDITKISQARKKARPPSERKPRSRRARLSL